MLDSKLQHSSSLSRVTAALSADMIQPNAIGISARSDAMVDECRPLHGRSSLGLTVEQFLCHVGGSISDDLVLGADDMLSPG